MNVKYTKKSVTFAAHTSVRPGFDLTSPAKNIRSASHRMGNLASTTEKSGAVGAFGKARRVDTICIPLRDVGPTAENCIFREKALLRSKYLIAVNSHTYIYIPDSNIC